MNNKMYFESDAAKYLYNIILEDFDDPIKTFYTIIDDIIHLLRLDKDKEYTPKIFNPSHPKIIEAFYKIGEEMTEKLSDPLGDYYQAVITHGEHGQFFTPFQICKLMVKETHQNLKRKPNQKFIKMLDPACGSGRLLITYHHKYPQDNVIYTAVDISEHLVKITTINFVFYGLKGIVLKGDSLLNQYEWGYKIIPPRIKKLTDKEVKLATKSPSIKK